MSTKMRKLQKIEKLTTKCSNPELVNQLIDKYLSDARSSVEHTLNMSVTVLAMHEQTKSGLLKEMDLDFFCLSVGLDKKSATFRKFCCIGAYAEKFHLVIDRLPSAYTTLYEITTLDPEKFEWMLSHDLVTPNLTLKEVKALTNKVSNPKTQVQNESVVVTFELNSLDKKTCQIVHQMIETAKSFKSIDVNVQNAGTLDLFLMKEAA